MSSETSIKDSQPDALQPWQLFTLAGLIGATVVVFVSKGQTPAGIILLSITIFTAAVVGVAAWRTFAPFSGAVDPDAPQILGGRTRAALEREKALVLRSIKELEFDRAMGKVSEKDFAEMSARLRSRAAGLLRQLDAGTGYREAIEKEVAKRLSAGSKDPAYAPKSDAHAGPKSDGHVGRVLGPAERKCAACGTVVDSDARFCKHCGARVEAAS
jgi:hypothetical protein